ncbi:hypothetical protein NE237_000868 [Protea cynaroides]|uniref:RNase H type-1 domain-containing protein n=1 Tax=Protea cynaroides TaxID=273540 RepID=A0A9Q0QXW1_9MAGN|nr:hypothetical protein NE237_000868 [Protea cynaroides]
MIANFSNILRSQRLLNQIPVALCLRKLHKEAYIPVKWRKPDIGWTKLNFDGSKSKTGMGSIGGVFRNHKAEFLLGYAESIGKTTSMEAELEALRRGLELVLENGWYDVWLEGDAKSLIDIITQRKSFRSDEVQKNVRHINLIIPELNNCIMTHIYREGNRAADKLAQMGHQSDKPRIWRHDPPAEVLRIMHEDAQARFRVSGIQGDEDSGGLQFGLGSSREVHMSDLDGGRVFSSGKGDLWYGFGDVDESGHDRGIWYGAPDVSAAQQIGCVEPRICKGTVKA